MVDSTYFRGLHKNVAGIWDSREFRNEMDSPFISSVLQFVI